MNILADLRSDTLTKPCPEMRRVMAEAEVGDDVYGEDPTIKRLEERAAELVGKEAALFVSSGTMGNLIAVLTHTKRGDEVLLGADSHIFYYEVGGMAALAGVIPRTLYNPEGRLTPQLLSTAWRASDLHFAPSSLVCLENTANRGGGYVTTPEEMRRMGEDARAHGCKVHLDGARIFNAAIYLKKDVRELVCDVDSVMFCLSKGLGAPVGSILAGEKEFIERARKYRKMLGGGLRQAGIIAAAGLFALENLIERLEDDHRRAGELAQGLVKLPGISIDLERVQTNILMVDFAPEKISAPEVSRRLKERNVFANAVNEQRLRFVTHRDVDDAQIEYVLQTMKGILA